MFVNLIMDSQYSSGSERKADEISYKTKITTSQNLRGEQVQIKYTTTAYNSYNKDIGSFEIYGHGFGKGTMSMTILVDEAYQGKGISKGLIKFTCEYLLINNVVTLDQLIFIDTDASGGFWKAVGMDINRYAERWNRTVDGVGQEMVITINNLYMWATEKKQKTGYGTKGKATSIKKTKSKSKSKRNYVYNNLDLKNEEQKKLYFKLYYKKNKENYYKPTKRGRYKQKINKFKVEKGVFILYF